MNKEELKKLNESIKHCEDVISNLKLKENCDECLKQHEQLKKWLIEYKNLINPQPYKFEELKDEMWVWDNKEKKYIKSCNNFDTEEYGKGIRVQIGFDLVRYPYEENRFYRKQVEE